MKSFDDVRRSGGSVGVVFSRRGVAASSVVAFAVVAACSSSSKKTGTSSTPLQCLTPVPEIADAAALVAAGNGTCAQPGGPWTGPEDTHCEGTDGGEMRQVTETSGCCAAPTDAGDDGGYTETCNANSTVVSGPDNGTCCSNAYNPTMWNTQGSDDDCKYDVSWSSTPICLNTPVYFTVHANLRVNATTFGSGAPLTGAGPYIEAVLDCATAASAKQPPPVESQPGVYQVGPIVFLNPGVWSVRFHFNENCDDLVPYSPHGHAAFWVLVPGADGGVPGELEASALEAVDASSSGSADAESGAASDALSSGSSDAATDAVEQ